MSDPTKSTADSCVDSIAQRFAGSESLYTGLELNEDSVTIEGQEIQVSNPPSDQFRSGGYDVTFLTPEAIARFHQILTPCNSTLIFGNEASQNRILAAERYINELRNTDTIQHQDTNTISELEIGIYVATRQCSDGETTNCIIPTELAQNLNRYYDLASRLLVLYPAPPPVPTEVPAAVGSDTSTAPTTEEGVTGEEAPPAAEPEVISPEEPATAVTLVAPATPAPSGPSGATDPSGPSTPAAPPIGGAPAGVDTTP